MNKFIPVLLIGLLSACATQQQKPVAVIETAPTPAPVKEAEPEKMQVTDAAVEAAPVKQAAVAAEPAKEAEDLLAKRSIFFDFDKFEIKPEYQALIEAHGQYLAKHPASQAVLEGSADERGSREYNLALGQKRAVSVMNALKGLGATESQMETISFGEDKPMVEGHDEDAWSHNRRTDIKYK